jgi:hypothetical protein
MGTQGFTFIIGTDRDLGLLFQLMKRPKIVRKLDIRHVLHNARADNPNTLPNRTRESNQINFDWQVPVCGNARNFARRGNRRDAEEALQDGTEEMSNIAQYVFASLG